jgi:hypothetical protein
MANTVGEFYKGRYGGVDNIKETIYQDPTGVLLDLSTLLSMGGTGLTRFGQFSKIKKVSEVGKFLSKAGEVTNPITQGVKLLGKGLEKSTSGKKIGGSKYTTENLSATDNLGIDRGDLPIFATTKSPISTTAEAVSSKGLGGGKIWDRMANIYDKMNDTVDSLVRGKLDSSVIGRNITSAVDDFKNDFFTEKSHVLIKIPLNIVIVFPKELIFNRLIIPLPSFITEIGGFDQLFNFTYHFLFCICSLKTIIIWVDVCINSWYPTSNIFKNFNIRFTFVKKTLMKRSNCHVGFERFQKFRIFIDVLPTMVEDLS